MLQLLAEATRLKPGVFVNPREKAEPEPTLWWTPEKDPDLDLLFQNLKEKDWSREELEARGWATMKNGQIALTPEGVIAAVENWSSSQNVTTMWCGWNITPPVYAKICARVAQRATRSASMGEVEDIVHHYVMNVCQNNSFRSGLLRGLTPSVAQIVSWALRAAFSVWRGLSKDAVGRASTGARSAADRAAGGEADVGQRTSPDASLGLFLVEDDEGMGVAAGNCGGSAPLVDVSGGDLESEIQTRYDQAAKQRLLMDTLESMPPYLQQEVQQMLRALATEETAVAVSYATGFSRPRLESLENSLRDFAQWTKNRDQVLDYLEENPWSTLEDMNMPSNNDVDASSGGVGVPVTLAMMDWLISQKLVSPPVRGCYNLARKGCTYEGAHAVL